MKRTCFLPLLSCLVVLLMTACDLDLAADGTFYGHWHLERIDTLEGGSCDLSRNLVFWSVQNRLIECADRGSAHTPVISRFERASDSLFFERLYYSDRVAGDPIVEDTGHVAVFGLHSLAPRFRVEHLSGHRMLLSDGRLRLAFRKL